LVPELVFVSLDPEIAKTEPDPEIQDLIRASGGLNLGLDYLPGSVMFDPVADKPDSDLASRIVWFDAFVNENSPFSTIAENRQAYVAYLTRRLDEPRHFVEDAIRAR